MPFAQIPRSREGTHCMTTHLQHKEKHHMTLLKPILSSTLLILGCAFASAQNSANEPDANSDASYNYNFQTVNFSGDAFTQLLGINSYSEIAGYHGSGAAGHPNKGFRLTLPKQFASENFPKSAQTQVIGINKRGDTDGFYVDTAGKTHGFINVNGSFKSVDFPGSTFNQLLGINDYDQAAGYLQDSQGNFHPYSSAPTRWICGACQSLGRTH
jgi:hypothetical protein